jgi:hypothetical protein
MRFILWKICTHQIRCAFAAFSPDPSQRHAAKSAGLKATHNFLNFTSDQLGLANTGNYSSEDLWVARLLGLEYSILNLLGEMLPCVDPGVSVGDIAIVFDKGMVTNPKYASWVVINVRSQRRNTHAHKLTNWPIVSKNFWPENYYEKMLSNRPRRNEQSITC